MIESVLCLFAINTEAILMAVYMVYRTNFEPTTSGS
jgi:hypothetical protein